jgi:hypothetical protein
LRLVVAVVVALLFLTPVTAVAVVAPGILQ